jgi:dihydroxy-acid dehydratase
VGEAVGAHAVGNPSDEELLDLEHHACPGAGSCAGMYTANTMASLAEGLGLAPLGSATPPAESDERLAFARRTGEVAMDCVEAGRRPSDVLSRASFENAIALLAAIGGSTNGVLHLLAIAAEAGVDLALEDFDRISRRTPHVCDFRPGGHHVMTDLHDVGGVPVVLRRLLDAGLVDQVEVALVPVLLGDGIPLLAPGQGGSRLELRDLTPYPSGIVLFRYGVDDG